MCLPLLKSLFSTRKEATHTERAPNKSINENPKMTFTPVVLILGAGPRIGASVAEKFASKGYKVAVASRKGTDTTTPEGFFSVKADFANPESIIDVFKTVKSHFGAAPSVVIYNAPSLTPPPAQDSIFSIPAARFTHDLNVNTISAYAAAQEAVAGWESLPKEAKKSFIYTGNMLNVAVLPVPLMVDLGVGKAASAYWIGVADATLSAKGYRLVHSGFSVGMSYQC